MSLSLSLSILVYHSCCIPIYEFDSSYLLFDIMDFDRKGEGGRWAQKGPTLFLVCVLLLN